jgi:hypothetical protein
MELVRSAPEFGNACRQLFDARRCASAPTRRRYTPGPGAYLLAVYNAANRHGAPASPSFTFGHRAASTTFEQDAARSPSPGPVYTPVMPAAQVALHAPPGQSFERAGVMARCSYHRDKPSNDPHWNPGAQYTPVRHCSSHADMFYSEARPGLSGILSNAMGIMQPQHWRKLGDMLHCTSHVVFLQEVDNTGRALDASGAAPAPRFSRSARRGPALALTASSGVSGMPLPFRGQERENFSVFSPGPKYHPEPNPAESPARPWPRHCSLGRLGTREFDRVVAAGQCGPGPIFPSHRCTRHGRGLWDQQVRICAST